MRGDYIVIEGLEGAGKTTVSSIIVNILKGLGVQEITSVHEPGGTRFSETLRCLVLDSKLSEYEVINNKTEALIFYAARIQLIETVIKPALKAGHWVVGDRYDLSTQAYQGGGRGVDRAMLAALRNVILGSFRPGIVFYLDVKPEVGLSRIRCRGKLDRIERESLEFFNRVRARYLELAEQDVTIHVIDAMQSLKIVTDTIRKIIIPFFQERQI